MRLTKKNMLLKIFLIIISFFLISTTISCVSNTKITKIKNDDCYTESVTVLDSDNKDKIINNRTTVLCTENPGKVITETGLAKNCNYFYYNIPLGNTMVKQRGISCKKLDGGYEIIPEYRGGR